MSTPPPIPLFDLGRVLFDIDFDRCFESWSSASGVAVTALRERFAASDDLLAHERGELDCDAFFERLAASLGVDLDVDAMRSGWNAIFGPDLPGVHERIEQLAALTPCHVLSNTNEAHARHFRVRYAPLLSHMTSVFTSHELGLRKPDPEIFRTVVRHLDVDPARLHFFDDGAANVEAARAVGLESTLVASPSDMPAELDALIRAHAAV